MRAVAIGIAAAGVGMGEVGANYGPCYTYAKNYTGLWQVYFEGIGAGSRRRVHR